MYKVRRLGGLPSKPILVVLWCKALLGLHPQPRKYLSNTPEVQARVPYFRGGGCGLWSAGAGGWGVGIDAGF